MKKFTNLSCRLGMILWLLGLFMQPAVHAAADEKASYLAYYATFKKKVEDFYNTLDQTTLKALTNAMAELSWETREYYTKFKNMELKNSLTEKCKPKKGTLKVSEKILTDTYCLQLEIINDLDAKKSKEDIHNKIKAKVKTIIPNFISGLYDETEIEFLQMITAFVKAKDQASLTKDLTKKIVQISKILQLNYSLFAQEDLKNNIIRMSESLKSELNKDSLTNLRALKYFMEKKVIDLLDAKKSEKDVDEKRLDALIPFAEYLEHFKPEYADLETIFISPRDYTFDKARTDNALALLKISKRNDKLISDYISNLEKLKKDPTNATIRSALNLAVLDFFTAIKKDAEDMTKYASINSGDAQKMLAAQKEALSSTSALEPQKTIKTIFNRMFSEIAELIKKGNKITPAKISEIYQREMAAALRKMIPTQDKPKTDGSLPGDTTSIDNLATALKGLLSEKAPYLDKKSSGQLVISVIEAAFQYYTASKEDKATKKKILQEEISLLKNDTKAMQDIQTYPSRLMTEFTEEKDKTTDIIAQYETYRDVLAGIADIDNSVIKKADIQKLSDTIKKIVNALPPLEKKEVEDKKEELKKTTGWWDYLTSWWK